MSEAQAYAESIFSGLPVYRLDSGRPLCRMIPDDHPGIRNKGSISLLLSPIDAEFVVKISCARKAPQDGYIGLEGSDEEGITAITESSLQSMGFAVNPHTLVKRQDSCNGTPIGPRAYFVTPNLATRGHHVYDIGEAPLESLVNGADIKKEFEEAMSIVIGHIRSGDYIYMPNAHLLTATQAIEHMFLCRVNNETKKGEIILGDFNHILLERYDPQKQQMSVPLD